MSNHDLKPTEYSNTVVTQNSENASVVSVFPLVQDIEITVQPSDQMVSNVTNTPTAPPAPTNITSGGSSY